MLQRWGLDTVRITKIKVQHSMVLDGRVREQDRVGNSAADEAAVFGRRRVGNAVSAGRWLSGVFGRWYPVILSLRRFFIAISRAVVNHDGSDGTAPDPLVWSAGALPVLSLKGVDWFMLLGILPCCLVLLLFGLLGGSIVQRLLLVLKMLLISPTL